MGNIINPLCYENFKLFLQVKLLDFFFKRDIYFVFPEELPKKN